MKKKILFVLLVFLTITSINAVGTKKEKEITDERAIILMNYLQYSLTQIVTHPYNKLVADHELNSIINTINPTMLKDQNIIEAYTLMIGSLSDLQLIHESKEHADELADRERRNAIYNIFNSTGSVFVPGQNPILSVVYVALNAGLNYAYSINQANDNKFINDFKYSKDLEIVVNDARKKLYENTAKAFSYRDDTNHIINGSEMQDFIYALKEEDFIVREHILKNLYESMKMFPPYWFALGYSQHKNGNYLEALESYKKYDSILNDEMVLTYDAIASQVYLSIIDVYMKIDKTKYMDEILIYTDKLQNQIKNASIEFKKRLSFSLACVYHLIEDNEKFQNEINNLFRFGDENWNNLTEVFNASSKENLAELLNINEEESTVESKDLSNSQINENKIYRFLVILSIFSIIFTVISYYDCPLKCIPLTVVHILILILFLKCIIAFPAYSIITFILNITGLCFWIEWLNYKSENEIVDKYVYLPIWILIVLINAVLIFY